MTDQQGDKDAESHAEGLCVVPAKGRVPPWFSVWVSQHQHLQVILQDPRCLADPIEIDDHACLRRWLIQRECATSDVLGHEVTIRGVDFRLSIEVVKDQGLKEGFESRRKGIIARKFFRDPARYPSVACITHPIIPTTRTHPIRK